MPCRQKTSCAILFGMRPLRHLPTGAPARSSTLRAAASSRSGCDVLILGWRIETLHCKARGRRRVRFGGPSSRARRRKEHE